MLIQKDVDTPAKVRTRLISSRLPIRAREKPIAEQMKEALCALNAFVTKKKGCHYLSKELVLQFFSGLLS